MYKRTHLTLSDEIGILQCVKSVIDKNFVSHDLFLYSLNWTGMMSKMAVRKS